MKQGWNPNPKGVKPTFIINPVTRFVYRVDSYSGRMIWSYKTEKGDWLRISDQDAMSNYHLIQVKRTLEEQNYKWSRWWYVVDAELRRRGIGITRTVRRVAA